MRRKRFYRTGSIIIASLVIGIITLSTYGPKAMASVSAPSKRCVRLDVPYGGKMPSYFSPTLSECEAKYVPEQHLTEEECKTSCSGNWSCYKLGDENFECLPHCYRQRYGAYAKPECLRDEDISFTGGCDPLKGAFYSQADCTSYVSDHSGRHTCVTVHNDSGKLSCTIRTALKDEPCSSSEVQVDTSVDNPNQLYDFDPCAASIRPKNCYGGLNCSDIVGRVDNGVACQTLGSGFFDSPGACYPSLQSCWHIKKSADPKTSPDYCVGYKAPACSPGDFGRETDCTSSPTLSKFCWVYTVSSGLGEHCEQQSTATPVSSACAGGGDTKAQCEYANRNKHKSCFKYDEGQDQCVEKTSVEFNAACPSGLSDFETCMQKSGSQKHQCYYPNQAKTDCIELSKLDPATYYVKQTCDTSSDILPTYPTKSSCLDSIIRQKAVDGLPGCGVGENNSGCWNSSEGNYCSNGWIPDATCGSSSKGRCCGPTEKGIFVQDHYGNTMLMRDTALCKLTRNALSNVSLWINNCVYPSDHGQW